MVWYGMVWYGMVWYGMYGMVWYGMVWYGISIRIRISISISFSINISISFSVSISFSFSISISISISIRSTWKTRSHRSRRQKKHQAKSRAVDANNTFDQGGGLDWADGNSCRSPPVSLLAGCEKRVQSLARAGLDQTLRSSSPEVALLLITGVMGSGVKSSLGHRHLGLGRGGGRSSAPLQLVESQG